MKKIGVMIVSGFLGSGKTTLLRRLAADSSTNQKIAMIINEFGELGLDEQIVKNEHQTQSLHIKQLSSGCICCSVSGDLKQALLDLCDFAPHPIERILIETSGVSWPSELSYTIHVIGEEAPFYTDSIITVVDAYQAKRSYKESPSLFLDQLAHADVILLNKEELLSPHEKDSLLDWIKPFAPRATWLFTSQCRVDPALLLGIEPKPLEPAQHLESISLTKKPHDFMQVTVPLDRTISYEQLEDFLSECADSIFRIKGIVNILDDQGISKPTIVQMVGDRIDTEPLIEIKGSQTKPFLVFIGRDLNKGELQAKLQRILVSQPKEEDRFIH